MPHYDITILRYAIIRFHCHAATCHLAFDVYAMTAMMVSTYADTPMLT